MLRSRSDLYEYPQGEYTFRPTSSSHTLEIKKSYFPLSAFSFRVTNVLSWEIGVKKDMGFLECTVISRKGIIVVISHPLSPIQNSISSLSEKEAPPS